MTEKKKKKIGNERLLYKENTKIKGVLQKRNQFYRKSKHFNNGFSVLYT